MGTENSENFISSVLSNANTFSPSKYQYLNTGINKQPTVPNAARTKVSKVSNHAGKHKLPMQLNRQQTTGQISVSVISPSSGAQSTQKEFHYKQQLQHMKTQSARSGGDGYKNNVHSKSSKVVPQSSVGVTITPVHNKSYKQNKSKMNNSVKSIVQSHTQNLPKYLVNNKFLVNAEKGDMYLHDDDIMGSFSDKRSQFNNCMSLSYQYVLQDHSYSQLPESTPSSIPSSPVQQRTTFNGLNKHPSSGKVTLNNNRIPNSGQAGFSSTTVNSNRLHNQPFAAFSNSVNSYSNVSSIVNSVTQSVISVNPKKNLHPQHGAGTFPNIPKGLLKTCVISDKPEESDLSEDDRIPDPHGEETETAPEADGEEESVTRCICDFQHDDGYMISCDRCLAWQHVDCMGIDWHQIPDEYQCEKCQPRYIDKRRAVEIQKKKIQEKLCIGLNDDSDSSDTPVNNSRNNKNQTKRKYKGKRTTSTKRKSIKETKETKPRKNLGAKKRQSNDSSLGLSSPNTPLTPTNSSMTAEKKKQLLLERKQMLLEKKQITKKRTMRKQTQNSKRNADKMKMDNDYESRSAGDYTDKIENNDRNILQVREWVDRYEEATTNHYSQELRARLSAPQINGVSSDLKYTASLRSVEKCRSSMMSSGGKIVIATTSLSPNQAIMELRGKYMYTGAESFKQSKISQFTPYVFYYKLSLPKQDIEICVDCRSYGNFARFIRRSCKPNAALRHCFRKTSLHLYIIATQPLKKNSEILIGHYSPETAGSCACASAESCTAAKTPYPTFCSRANEKLRESQGPPMSAEANSCKNKKTPVNADKNNKKKMKEEKKLPLEKRRGRRKSPSSATNSDECSSRDQSPSTPAKLTVSLWGKPAILLPSNPDHPHQASSDTESPSNDPVTAAALTPSENDESNANSADVTKTNCASPTNGNESENADNSTNLSSRLANDANTTSDMKDANDSEDASGNCTPKQNTRNTRQSDYAKKEKQQLDMPLFFQTPNNHKMTREEKKIQAIMKAFEAMEKSEARKQEIQKHRRESTSENETCAKKNTPVRKNLKYRRNTEEFKYRDNTAQKCDENGRIHDNFQTEDDDSEDKDEGKENAISRRRSIVKSEPKSEDSKIGIVENGGRLNDVKAECKEDEEEDEEEEEDGEEEVEEEESEEETNVANKKVGSAGKQRKISESKTNNTSAANGEEESDTENDDDDDASNKGKRNAKAKNGVPARTPRAPKSGPKARAVPKARTTRGKKRKSESDADASSGGTDIGDISERTRSAAQRQRKGTNTSYGKEDEDGKSAIGYTPIKYRKTNDLTMSPFSTPPKTRERLDSSSSSGGTPPTPVSDTCLLVASAIGHLTDFKFPNTKKELMNAWFKEERKPDDDSNGKNCNQEGNNECAKKRWLRQAISEEGDNSLPRPDEPSSPNGDYGGPLKKRRFARETISASNSFGALNQMSFDDEDDDSSPEVSLFQAGEGEDPTTLQMDTIKLKEPSILFKSEKIDVAGSEIDDEIAKVASENVADTIASILAPVNAQMASPPRPPSVPPPRIPSPPPEEPENAAQEVRCPAVSKKKLSLTEYQKRKGAVPVTPVATPEPVCDVIQEVPALAAALLPTTDAPEVVGRPSSRLSVTSSSGSEEEDDDSHAASAEVIARSLMIESRHLSYGPQASALFNSLRSGTSSTILNSKSPASSTTPLLRENLADRLKREFDVHVQQDEAEKIKNAQLTVSPIKTLVQVPVDVNQKDLHLMLKKGQPPPPPPPLPCIPPPLLPPLPDPPQLFAPSFYPYTVPRVAPFFAAPPPPPPPGCPPVSPLSLPLGPPPPPPPPSSSSSST